jgi:hypothetical protein
MPDAATAAALMQWRADALTRVNPAFHDAVAAMYADQPIQAPGTANAAAMAKAQAEQAALTDLDRSSQQLIERFFAVQAQSLANTAYTDNSD